jgi:hypothetical protein
MGRTTQGKLGYALQTTSGHGLALLTDERKPHRSDSRYPSAYGANAGSSAGGWPFSSAFLILVVAVCLASRHSLDNLANRHLRYSNATQKSEKEYGISWTSLCERWPSPIVSEGNSSSFI